MNRFSVERGGDENEPPRRRTRQLSHNGRWTDKVFVIPSAVAGVIARMNESFFGPPAPSPDTTPPAPRRHRGFYVWNPTVGPDGKRFGHGGMFRLIEEVDPRHTAERPMPKRT